ncbi:hypothetical protein LJK87_44645 [Paenibacillus sp. P25]|nr:hypothetical protein LJK87_44645 [Paenibacillus sp. P25]
MSEQIDDFDLELPDAYPEAIASNLDQVASLLAEAKRPLLFLGGALHAQKAYQEIEAFASRWSIPVATTPGGKGVIRSDHPLHLGPYGLGGNALTEAYLREGVDLMIVVGDQLSDLEIPGLSPALYPKHMVHFDYAPRFIGKALPIPTTAVLGSIRSNLQALLKYTSPRTAREIFLSLSKASRPMNPPAICAAKRSWRCFAKNSLRIRWFTGMPATTRSMRSNILTLSSRERFISKKSMPLWDGPSVTPSGLNSERRKERLPV